MLFNSLSVLEQGHCHFTRCHNLMGDSRTFPRPIAPATIPTGSPAYLRRSGGLLGRRPCRLNTHFSHTHIQPSPRPRNMTSQISLESVHPCPSQGRWLMSPSLLPSPGLQKGPPDWSSCPSGPTPSLPVHFPHLGRSDTSKRKSDVTLLFNSMSMASYCV